MSTYELRLIYIELKRVADALDRAYPPPAPEPKPEDEEEVADRPKGRTAGRRTSYVQKRY